MENAQVAGILDEIADLIALDDGNEYRVRSYRDAARTVHDLSQRLEDLAELGQELSELPNIGEATAEKIHEILETGTCGRLEEMRAKVPPKLIELLRVPQLGPQTVMQLHRDLGIESPEELRAACEEGLVRELEGMGEKTEEKILRGLDTLGSREARMLLRDAGDRVEGIGRHLDPVEAIERWEVAGSFRRRKETVGDLDILIQAEDRDQATDAILELRDLDEVLGRGEEKVSVKMSDGLQVDFRFFDKKSFGSAMLYFTGSKAHGIKLRKLAGERTWKLNEYGLFKGENLLAGSSEEAIYHRLNLQWISPELREDRGEIEAAREDNLPDLVELSQIRGDLQSHTNATDGSSSIRDMAEAAVTHGYEYFAITDHSKRVTMAKGLDDDGTRNHAEEIRQVDGELDSLWLMAGIEVDILRDGSLDLREKTLEELDWVVASTHYDLDMGEEAMTERLLSAVRSGVVHCLAHPTMRVLGKRTPISFDAHRVFEACAEQGVFLEVNAQPDRLDLPDFFCKQALQAGVKFVISTDAHKPSDLDFMNLGVDVARRGWLKRTDVANTLTAKEFRRVLGRE